MKKKTNIKMYKISVLGKILAHKILWFLEHLYLAIDVYHIYLFSSKCVNNFNYCPIKELFALGKNIFCNFGKVKRAWYEIHDLLFL